MGKIKFEKFDNITSYVRTIRTRKLNAYFADKEEQELSSVSGSLSFTGTESWEQAQDLLAFGDKKISDKVQDLMVSERRASFTTYRQQIRRATHGFMPCVPAYLSNSPRAMINANRTRPASGRVLTLVVSQDIYWAISVKETIDAAVKILSAVAALEKKGYRINIYALQATKEESRAHNIYAALIKIKDAGTYFDCLKMAYPLANPSFSRRHGFRYTETCECGPKDKFSAHGYTLSKYETEEVLKKNGIKYNTLLTFDDVSFSSAKTVLNTIVPKKYKYKR